MGLYFRIAKHFPLYLSIQLLKRNLCRTELNIFRAMVNRTICVEFRANGCDIAAACDACSAVTDHARRQLGGSDPTNFLGGPEPKKWGRSRPVS
jgi:hypothetical protein